MHNGSTFTILSNDGADAITGAFVGKPDDQTFVDDGITYRINYQGGDGNDVAVTRLIPEPGSAALLLLGVGTWGLISRRRQKS